MFFFIFDREQSLEGPKRSFVDVVLAVVVVVGGESFWNEQKFSSNKGVQGGFFKEINKRSLYVY